jgi:hypothetical protein
MPSVSKNTKLKTQHCIAILLLCFGLASCASTQQDRLAQIDSINAKLSGFLGASKTADKPVQNTKEAAKPKVRSPLIHGFIYDVAQSDKFIFFYSGKDARSIKLGETVKKYANETGMTVLAYTTDHSSSADFPASIFADQNTMEKYFGGHDGVKLPTLLLNQYDSYAAVIASGEISYLELVKRMNQCAEERVAKHTRKYYY